jgi:tight adherence protein B
MSAVSSMSLPTSSAVGAAIAAGLAVWLLVSPIGSSATRSRIRSSVVIVLGASAAVVLLPHGWVGPLLVVGPASWVAHLLWRRRTTARSAAATSTRMAEVCDLLAAELSAGRPPETALREASAAWPALVPVAEVARLGGDVPAALREVARTPGAGGLRLLAAAWSVSRRTGGSLGAATQRVAEAVRREQATRRVVAGELASARATARLMAALPILALLMGSGAGADPWSFLLRTPAGLGCLAAGLASGLAGVWWIEQIALGVEP